MSDENTANENTQEKEKQIIYASLDDLNKTKFSLKPGVEAIIIFDGALKSSD